MNENKQYKISFPLEKDGQGQRYLDLNFSKKEKSQKKKKKRFLKNKNDAQIKIDFDKAEQKRREQKRRIQEQKEREEDKEDREMLYQNYWENQHTKNHGIDENYENKKNLEVIEKIKGILDEMKFDIRKKLLLGVGMSNRIEDNREYFKDYKEVKKRIIEMKNVNFSAYLNLESFMGSYSSLRKLERSVSSDDLKSFSRGIKEIKNRKTNASINIKISPLYNRLKDLLDDIN